MRAALAFVAVAMPLLILRLAFWPRERGIADLTDHQLADIGLSRWDVAPPQSPRDDLVRRLGNIGHDRR